MKPWKSIGIALLSILLTGCALAPTASDAELSRFSGSFLDVFDTVTQVIVYETDEAAAEVQVRAIHDELLIYHQLFDIYNAYEGVNNLYTVNAQAGIAPVKVDGRVLDFIDYAKRMYTESGGKVNIAMGSVLSIWHAYREAGIEDPEHAALPPMDALREAARHMDIEQIVVDRDAGTVYLADADMRLDVGAIGKGYAGQRVVEMMRARGTTSMLLSLGGNVCGIGRRADGKDWKVGIQDPDMEHYLCYVSVNDQCLVTSGTYQRYYTVEGKRYHHIIDPETLMPAAYFDSVSVLCDDSALADALSTTLSILPLDEGTALVESLENVEAMWLDLSGKQTMSSGFMRFVTEG